MVRISVPGSKIKRLLRASKTLKRLLGQISWKTIWSASFMADSGAVKDL